jgi:hypothetical protein
VTRTSGLGHKKNGGMRGPNKSSRTDRWSGMAVRVEVRRQGYRDMRGAPWERATNGSMRKDLFRDFISQQNYTVPL